MRTPTTNPQIKGQPMSFVRLGSRAYKFTDSGGTPKRNVPSLGNSRISTAAAMADDNPPGSRKKRQLKRRRRGISTASRKRNRG